METDDLTTSLRRASEKIDRLNIFQTVDQSKTYLVIHCKLLTDGLHRNYFSSKGKYRGYQVLKKHDIIFEELSIKTVKDLQLIHLDLKLLYGSKDEREEHMRLQTARKVEEKLEKKILEKEEVVGEDTGDEENEKWYK